MSEKHPSPSAPKKPLGLAKLMELDDACDVILRHLGVKPSSQGEQEIRKRALVNSVLGMRDVPARSEGNADRSHESSYQIPDEIEEVIDNARSELQLGLELVRCLAGALDHDLTFNEEDIDFGAVAEAAFKILKPAIDRLDPLAIKEAIEKKAKDGSRDNSADDSTGDDSS